MSRFARAIACIAIFTLCACAAPEPEFTEADRAGVSTGASALVEDWARTGSEGRWEDLPTLYADEEGFAWIEQGVVRYPSVAAVREGVAQAADSGLAIRTEVTDVVVTPLSRDAAAVRAHVAIQFGEPPDSGFMFDGALSAVAVKRDGRWQFLQGHLSSPAPAPAAPE